jgi:class 3 adenylate cyclase/CHASE2 domain-containing sensor protein
MTPANLRAEPPNDFIPVWIREPWPILAVIGLAAIAFFVAGNPLVRLERLWTDLLLRVRSQAHLAPKPDSRIFLVGLETKNLGGDSTVAAEYKTYAEIVNMLSDLRVSVVALDFMMVRGRPEDAQEVMAAIRSSGRVVLAQARTPEMLAQSFLFAPREFEEGRVNISADSDGVHRRYAYGISEAQGCQPSLALAAYLKWQDARPEFACVGSSELTWKELGPDQKSLVDRTLTQRPVLLNFRSSFVEPWDRGFKYVGLSELRQGYTRWKAAGADLNAIPPGIPNKGSLVFVAANAIAVGDAGPTPFGRFEPLVDLHATALDDLMQGQMLTELPPLWNGVLITVVLVLLASFTRRIRSVRTFALVIVGAIVLLLVASAGLLFTRNLVIYAITPSSFLVLSLIAESGRRSNLASIEKAQLRANLGRYFSPRVLEEVLRDPNAFKPREAEITVLLTDLRNFTTITERSGTQRMFDLLNDVFEVQTRAVLSLDGSMEHFVGDQFVAYWGAPRDQPDDADLALRAAAIIFKGLDELKETLEPELKDLFGYGLAIHRGKALVGNKGSRMRLDFGILGDIINGCARIESLTKVYGVRQIITREVLERAADKPPVRFLDRVVVKGKAQPMEMFEVIQDLQPAAVEVRRRYEKAWQIYALGDFEAAAAAFEDLAGEDRPSKLLAARSRMFLESPPKDWTGAFHLSEK